MENTTSRAKVPKWFWIVAALGLAWNVFGVVQFMATAQGTVDSLMGNGLTKEQAQLYVGLPQWMTGAFAVGVFGGVIGSILLLMRMPAAKSVFGISLAAYIILYVGDITQGVFAAFGPSQVVILSTVVAIATGLLWTAIRQLQSAP
jgi:hypothetical protein